MMEEREDLRLSLSISTSESCFPLNLTLFPSLTASAPLRSKVQCAYSDEDAGACSPVSTLSEFCGGKRSNRDDEINEGEEDGYNSSKKLRLSKDQTVVLEESFKENSTLNPKQKQALAKQLNLRPRQVEVWFQNRRARTKLKQTEVDCEYLKRWCLRLAEENNRLQKEVMELRAVNRVSPMSSATNTIPSSAQLPLQLLPSYHLNLSATADSNPWNSYFSQAF